MQTPGTEYGPLFAELHAHLKYFSCQNDVGRMGMGYDFDFIELICEDQKDSLSL